jgi:hypothetical protein
MAEMTQSEKDAEQGAFDQFMEFAWIDGGELAAEPVRNFVYEA